MQHHVIGRWAASVVLAISISGCVTQQTTNQNQSTALNAGAGGAANRPAPAPAPRPSGPQVAHKTVPAGQTQNFGTFSALNPDCSSAGLPVLKIKQAPVHGTATVVQKNMYPNYPASNPRSACNSMQVPGVSIDYTPAQGFTGSDYMTVDVITATGGGGTVVYSITVE